MCFNYYWEILEKKREHRENTQLGFCWTRIQTPILWLHMPRTEILQVQGSYYPLPARCSSWYTVKSKEYWFWREIWIIILAFFFFLQPLGCAPNPEACPGPPGRRPPNAPLYLHFWRTTLLDKIVLVGSFFFHHFEYSISLSPGLHCFCWETHW